LEVGGDVRVRLSSGLRAPENVDHLPAQISPSIPQTQTHFHGLEVPPSGMKTIKDSEGERMTAGTKLCEFSQPTENKQLKGFSLHVIENTPS
jgi:hypothetical protein